MITTEIWFEASFNAGHWLPKVDGWHKCKRPHGHTYRVKIIARGPVGDDGFVVDYDVLRKAWLPIFDDVDHRSLNDVPGLDNPTSEIIAKWIGDRMRIDVPIVCEVHVRETEHAGSIVRWEQDAVDAGPMDFVVFRTDDRTRVESFDTFYSLYGTWTEDIERAKRMTRREAQDFIAQYGGAIREVQ